MALIFLAVVMMLFHETSRYNSTIQRLPGGLGNLIKAKMGGVTLKLSICGTFRYVVMFLGRKYFGNCIHSTVLSVSPKVFSFQSVTATCKSVWLDIPRFILPIIFVLSLCFPKWPEMLTFV